MAKGKTGKATIHIKGLGRDNLKSRSKCKDNCLMFECAWHSKYKNSPELKNDGCILCYNSKGYLVIDDHQQLVHPNCAFYSRMYEIVSYSKMEFKRIVDHLELNTDKSKKGDVCEKSKGYLLKCNKLDGNEYIHINCILTSIREEVYQSFINKKDDDEDIDIKNSGGRSLKIYFSNLKGQKINDNKEEITGELSSNPNILLYGKNAGMTVKRYGVGNKFDICKYQEEQAYRFENKNETPYNLVEGEYCYDWVHPICVQQCYNEDIYSYEKLACPTGESTSRADTLLTEYLSKFDSKMDKDKEKRKYLLNLLRSNKISHEIIPRISQEKNNIGEITFINLITLQEFWGEFSKLVISNVSNVNLIQYLLDEIKIIPFHSQEINILIPQLNKKLDSYNKIKDSIQLQYDGKVSLFCSYIDRGGDIKEISSLNKELQDKCLRVLNDAESLGLVTPETKLAEEIKTLNEKLSDVKDKITSNFKYSPIQLEKLGDEILEFYMKYDPDKLENLNEYLILGGYLKEYESWKKESLMIFIDSHKKAQPYHERICTLMQNISLHERQIENSSKSSTNSQNVVEQNESKLWNLRKELITNISEMLHTLVSKETLENIIEKGQNLTKVDAKVDYNFLIILKDDLVNLDKEREKKLNESLYEINYDLITNIKVSTPLTIQIGDKIKDYIEWNCRIIELKASLKFRDTKDYKSVLKLDMDQALKEGKIKQFPIDSLEKLESFIKEKFKYEENKINSVKKFLKSPKKRYGAFHVQYKEIANISSEDIEIIKFKEDFKILEKIHSFLKFIKSAKEPQFKMSDLDEIKTGIANLNKEFNDFSEVKEFEIKYDEIKLKQDEIKLISHSIGSQLLPEDNDSSELFDKAITLSQMLQSQYNIESNMDKTVQGYKYANEWATKVGKIIKDFTEKDLNYGSLTQKNPLIVLLLNNCDLYSKISKIEINSDAIHTESSNNLRKAITIVESINKIRNFNLNHSIQDYFDIEKDIKCIEFDKYVQTIKANNQQCIIDKYIEIIKVIDVMNLTCGHIKRIIEGFLSTTPGAELPDFDTKLLKTLGKDLKDKGMEKSEYNILHSMLYVIKKYDDYLYLSTLDYFEVEKGKLESLSFDDKLKMYHSLKKEYKKVTGFCEHFKAILKKSELGKSLLKINSSVHTKFSDFISNVLKNYNELLPKEEVKLKK